MVLFLEVTTTNEKGHTWHHPSKEEKNKEAAPPNREAVKTEETMWTRAPSATFALMI